MLKAYLQKSTLKGTVKELMTPGLAVEFIQPWYTPLTTTPATTGIPVGGIGSTFTVTPAGTTPVLNFVPGIQVQGTAQTPLFLNNFFFAESVVGNSLQITDLANFLRKLAFYPLVDAEGRKLFKPVHQGSDPLIHSQTELSRALADTTLWKANSPLIERWKVELSPRTLAMIQSGNTASVEFNAAWLMDFFDGTVGFPIDAQGSLTAAWGEQNQILGQPCYPAEAMEYHALYPASMLQFNGKQKVKISRIQYSPVIPGNERLSSLPVHCTAFELSNPTSDRLQVTLVQMQDNLCGYQVLKERQGVQDASFNLQAAARFPTGQVFSKKLSDGRQVQGIEFATGAEGSDFDGRMAISVCTNAASHVSVTVKPRFYTDQQKIVLEGALVSGRVNQDYVRNVYSGRETMAGALCVTVVLEPGQSTDLLFNMVLDFAKISLNGLVSSKKYTQYYPNAEGRTQAMLTEVLEQEHRLREDIARSYESLISPENIKTLYPEAGPQSESFRTLAINTLAFLAEATVWDKEDRYLVRECADYPFFNSLDVYFYGSFSLLTLMPKLDGAVMRRFADAVLAEDPKVRRHHEYVNHPYADMPYAKLEGPRGVRGAVIHDLGSPFDAAPDAYDWHNVKEWKDLAPKFVLMVLRHVHVTGDRTVLEYCKEAVYASMEYLEKMVEPGQLFPLTHGTDDTFDNLSSHGISVYCGSLWIAGLRAAGQIASQLGDSAKSKAWSEWAVKAEAQFHEALWDEKEGYFHFFVTPVSVEDLRQDRVEALKSAMPQVLASATDLVSVVETLNRYLNLSDPNASSSRREQRRAKKQLLLESAPGSFTESFRHKIDLDSDDVFVDSLLADTYLRLLGLAPVTDGAKARRSLTKVFQVNYKANSPRIGAANLVHKDGSPLDEFNFQAHDVWIGIQYSLMAAMAMHGMTSEARELGDSMVRNLYSEARIPFAAPEGFNGSCRLHGRDVAKVMGIDATSADSLVAQLKKEGALLSDGRISPQLPRDPGTFNKHHGHTASAHKVDSDLLFKLMHSTALKYTAGRYFRPGMVWAVPMAC